MAVSETTSIHGRYYCCQSCVSCFLRHSLLQHVINGFISCGCTQEEASKAPARWQTGLMPAMRLAGSSCWKQGMAVTSSPWHTSCRIRYGWSAAPRHAQLKMCNAQWTHITLLSDALAPCTSALASLCLCWEPSAHGCFCLRSSGHSGLLVCNVVTLVHGSSLLHGG